MQKIWAKILAGEVSRPGNISFRTLEVISNISSREAEQFQVACSLASSNRLIWKIGRDNSLDDFGLNYGDILLLRDAGLIHDNDNLQKIFKVIPQIGISVLHIGNSLYQIKNLKNTELKEFRFNQIAFTTAGKELCKFINANLNIEYTAALIKNKQNEGYEIMEIRNQTTDNTHS